MSPGSNKRPTGTVPKAKASRKNSVPQEMVAPTRRDLQQHLNDFFASVQRASKTDNNRTPGEGTCYELDNFSIPENTRSCWPVRPIPRRNFLHDAINNHDPHGGSTQNQLGSTNAAIGVVIPTTPNSTLHQQQNHLNEQLLQQNHHHHHQQHLQQHHHTQNNLTSNHPSSSSSNTHNNLLQTNNLRRANLSPDYINSETSPMLSMRVPDGAPQQVSISNNLLPQNLHSVAAITAAARGVVSNAGNVGVAGSICGVTGNSHNVIANSAAGGGGGSDGQLNVEERLNQIQDYIRITTTLIDSIHAERTNGARPQSVASIHTTTPNTPTYEELQGKLETSNRNIMHIKEQQQQLLRIQQAAKNQLYEMEQLRAQQAPMSFAGNQNAVPDYENVDDVAQDVTALMARMKTLTDFIHSQNDLAASLGVDEKTELVEEQLQLQKKLNELKNKKQQMANLVNELQTMNSQADNNFETQNDHRATAAEYERIPLEFLQNSRLNQVAATGVQAVSGQQQSNRYAPTEAVAAKNINGSMIGIVHAKPPASNDVEEEDDDDDGGAAIEHDDILQDKIAEINAMKDQLKRLQDMMHTVKLIEIKNGDCNPDDDAVNFDEKPQNSTSNLQTSTSVDDPQRDEEEQEMAERVRALHSMTNDLRQQAVSLAAERDRLKDIKNEMARRRDYDGPEKNFKQQQQQQQQQQQHLATAQKDQELETEYEQKKKEFHNIVENLESNDTRRGKKELSQPPDTLFYSSNNWPPATARQQNVSSTSSLRSGQGGCHPPDNNLAIKPTPSNCNQGKDSADSGAADVLNMSVDAGSLQSGSSRGFSVPPPMRNISGRDGPWRKSSQEISRMSSINNQTNQAYENQNEHHSPWYWHNNGYYNQGYSSAAPQSPHCHYHHHIGGSEQHYCRSVCIPQITAVPAPGSTNDPMLMQQFIQTQQMLINSMSQCNQLLWDQQREINNLNSAVLLIQERLLNSTANCVDSNPSAVLRAESVPPNVVCTNQTPFLPRAQSEQPNFAQATTPQQQHVPPQVNPSSSSPFRQYNTNACAQNAHIYRNNGQGVRLLRHSLLNTGRNAIGTPTYYESEQHSPSVNANQQLQYSNNFLNAQTLSNHQDNAVLLNNDPNSPLPTNNNASQQQQSPPIFIHHNNNTAAATPNNATNINNLHQQNLTNASAIAAAAVAVASSTPITNNNANTTNTAARVYSPSVSQAPALNNQVAPGNRANNYWDNFRSYSRQNLLSSGSCKSNEDVCNTMSNASPHNRDVHQHLYPNQNTSSLSSSYNTAGGSVGGGSGIGTICSRNAPPPTQMTHNNLPAMGNNKYIIQFRNQINQQQEQQQQQQQQHQNTPDVLNVNQQRHYQHPHDILDNGSSNTNYNNLKLTSSSAAAVAAATVLAQSTATSSTTATNNQQYLLCSGSGSTSSIAPAGNVSNTETNTLNSLNNNSNHNATMVNNISSYNFDLNELKQPKMMTKMVQKVSTGGSKRVRPLRDATLPVNERENNLGAAANGTGIGSISSQHSHDLNLASTSSMRQDSKSSAKLFDDLKENVYLEVSALIAANESRPHFLINLFRELQLISTSDPLRKRLMQAFQELYSQYCESNTVTAAAIVLPDMQMSTSTIQNDLENPQHDSTQHTGEHHQFNQSATNYASSVGTTPVCVPDLQSSIDEGLLRSIIHDVRELLHHESGEISDMGVQRLAGIVARYLSNASAVSSTPNAINHKELFDEIHSNIRRFDRRGHGKFLEKLENYINCLLVSASSASSIVQNDSINSQTDNNDSDDQFDRRMGECNYLDLRPKQEPFVASLKSNELLLTLRKKDDHENTIPSVVGAPTALADVVAIVGHVLPQPKTVSSASSTSPLSHSTPTHHMPSNDNQDLAEADQICNNENDGSLVLNLSVSPELNVANGNRTTNTSSPENDISNEIIGAVGGGGSSSVSSQLPDLAKVSTTSSRIMSFEEESMNLANAEVERITNQSFDLANTNCHRNGRSSPTTTE